jgi:hypothetical protein
MSGLLGVINEEIISGNIDIPCHWSNAKTSML